MFAAARQKQSANCAAAGGLGGMGFITFADFAKRVKVAESRGFGERGLEGAEELLGDPGAGEQRLAAVEQQQQTRVAVARDLWVAEIEDGEPLFLELQREHALWWNHSGSGVRTKSAAMCGNRCSSIYLVVEI